MSAMSRPQLSAPKLSEREWTTVMNSPVIPVIGRFVTMLEVPVRTSTLVELSTRVIEESPTYDGKDAAISFRDLPWVCG
jgi:hypothetical protein